MVSLLIVATLAGCASRSLNPPPIEDRSARGAVRPPPSTPPVATSTPIDASPVAVPTPIGNEAVEQRPLGTPSIAPPAPSSSAPLKSEPIGAKRPYSDAAMADLARSDGSSPPTVAPSTETPPPVVPPAAPTLTWAWPASGKVTTNYGGKSNGIDIAGNAGDAIVAAADGKVTFAGTGVRGYGNFVIVRHTPELLSVYANNKANLVKEGAAVTRGQKIAEMGQSDTTSPRLHFEIRSDSRPIDPLKYLPAR